MAVAKVILNGVTQMDLTSDTVGSSTALSGYTGHGANGEAFQGAYAIPSGTLSITANGTYDVASYASANVAVSGGGGSSIYTASIYTRAYYNNLDPSLLNYDTFAVTSPSGSVISNVGEYFTFSSGDILQVTMSGQIYENMLPLCSLSEIATTSYIAPATDLRIEVCIDLARAHADFVTDIFEKKANGVFLGSYIGEYEDSRYTYVKASAFTFTSITTASFPSATVIQTSAFAHTGHLSKVYFPLVSRFQAYALYNCCISEASYSLATSVMSWAFATCQLKRVDFPLLNVISASVFMNNGDLTSVSIPNATTIGSHAFSSCASLPLVSFTKAQTIGISAFFGCTSLSTAIFSYESATGGMLNGSAFSKCCNLLSLYLFGGFYQLSNVNAFTSTPISNYTTSTGGVYGSIFVPESLYSSYISATNWTTYSDRIVSLTDAQIQNVLTYGTHEPQV